MATRRLPVLRRDCAPGGSLHIRPCPFASCKWQNEDGTCVLDIADDGGATLHEVGEHIGVTRERVRQIETNALRKLARAARRHGLTVEDVLGINRPRHALDFGANTDSRGRDRSKLAVYRERWEQKHG